MTIYRRVSIRLSWLVAVMAIALVAAALPEPVTAQAQGQAQPGADHAELQGRGHSQIIEAVAEAPARTSSSTRG